MAKPSICHKQQIQSLIGKLVFVAKCVRPGRLSLARMLEYLRSTPDKGKHPLSQGFKDNLGWWKSFLRQFNGIRLIPPAVWQDPDAHLATDACLQGCGGICQGEYFAGQFPLAWAQWHINQLKLAMLMVALKLWAT